MTTDWIIVRRLAAELDRALRGSRVEGVGLLDDGRFALHVGARRGRPDATLAVDTFGSPPLPLLVPRESATGPDPAWLKPAAVALRGLRVTGVRARRGDRVLVVTLATQSRFGVTSELRLVLELVPRFGNVLVVRDRTIIAAAKQFSPAENAARSIVVGGAYAPPPLPGARIDRAGFLVAVATDASGGARALEAYRPLLPRLIADSLAAEGATLSWPSAAQHATWLERKADAVLESTAGEPDGLGDVWAYFEGDRLIAAHILPLAQFRSARLERVPELLPVVALARGHAELVATSSRLERRRSSLATRIAKRRAAVEAEHGAVAATLRDAHGRDRLRIAGDALFTHAHDVPRGATAFVPPTRPELTLALDPELDAKGNAAAYFARYRKASDALPHLERRLATLAARSASLEDLAFETERADAATLDDIAAALDDLEGRRAPSVHRPRAKARPILRYEQPSGARIFVGRSPRENVEVTFRIARPDDLWFHARNVPGSHVILQAPDGAAPADADLDLAANLAAAHSRAHTAPRVDVDYTERKYVRKQRDAAPGLVWYTGARTRVGHPQAQRPA